MSAVLKLTRTTTDRVLARIADPEAIAAVAAERAAVDATIASVAPASASPVTIVDTAKLAQLLDLDPRTVRNMRADRRIPADAVIEVGGRVRYDLARVLDALRASRRAPEMGVVRTVDEGDESARAWVRRRAGMRLVPGGQ